MSPWWIFLHMVKIFLTILKHGESWTNTCFIVLAFCGYNSEAWPRKTYKLGEFAPNFILVEVKLPNCFGKLIMLMVDLDQTNLIKKVDVGEDSRVSSRLWYTQRWVWNVSNNQKLARFVLYISKLSISLWKIIYAS